MARQLWSLKDSGAIQKRINALITNRYGAARGRQQRFLEECGLPRDTMTKWFRKSRRVPDTQSLRQIATKLDVSLDWLLLGVGDMYRTETARDQLFNQLREEVNRRGSPNDDAAEMRHLKRIDRVLAMMGSNRVWEAVVEGFEDLPEIAEAIEYDEQRDPNYT